MTISKTAQRLSKEEIAEVKKTHQAYINRIKSEINLEEVLACLGIRHKLIGRSAFSLCPYPDHNEKTPSFSSSFSSNLWKCFGCGRGGDSITLVRDLVTGGDWSETLKWFNSNFNLLSPSGMKKQLQVRETSNLNKPVIIELSQALTASDEVFDYYDEVYQALIDELPLDEYGADEMKNRGVTRNWAERLGYCNLPVGYTLRAEIADLFAERFRLDENPVPGFFRLKYKDKLGKWCFAGDRAGARYVGLKIKPELAPNSLPVATLEMAEKTPETVSDLIKHKYTFDFGAKDKVYYGGLLVPHRDRHGRIRAFKIRNQSFSPELWLRAQKVSRRFTTESALEYIRELPNEMQENYLAYKEFWSPKYIALSSTKDRNGTGALLGVHWSQGAQVRRIIEEEYFSLEFQTTKPDYSGFSCPITNRFDFRQYPATMVEPSPSVLWLTEGELKADLIGYRLGVNVAALPGVLGHHFELFWEMGCYGNLPVQKAHEIYTKIEDARIKWQEYKFNKYKIKEFDGQDVNIQDAEIQKRLIFAKLDEGDISLLVDRFGTAEKNQSDYKVLILALDEDFSVNVEKAAHRLAWHALHLNLPVVRCRWNGNIGKGFDDLLAENGLWWLEGLQTKL